MGRDRKGEATGFDAETTSSGAGGEDACPEEDLRLHEAAGAWEGPSHVFFLIFILTFE